MNFPKRWMQHPQGTWLRKALFQIHLWAGVVTGLYILLISITGSIVVFRNEIYRAYTPRPRVRVSGPRLSEDELRQAAKRAYPDFQISSVLTSRRATDATEIWMAHDKKEIRRLFDPYTGNDLADAVSLVIRIEAWLLDLHVNLLYGEKGRIVNGIGAIVVTLVALTGLVIWWPGTKTWRRSLTVQLQSNWKRFNWDLHSAVGFWTFLLTFMWALTGIAVSFPNSFYAAVNYWDEHYSRFFRLSDDLFRWCARLHFGSFAAGTFAGWPVKVLWLLLGLAPGVLFVTAAVMWWNRVLRPRLQMNGFFAPRARGDHAQRHTEIVRDEV